MKNLLATFAALLLLTACQQSTVTETPLVEKDATESSATINTVATTNMKFEHRMPAERAQVGVPFDIELDFTGSSDSVLNAEFSTSASLNMMSKASANIQMNKTGKAETQTITVVPQTEGIHYVNIYQPGAAQKPSVIRIIAGDKDIKEYLKTPGEVVDQEDGSKIISMPADEG